MKRVLSILALCITMVSAFGQAPLISIRDIQSGLNQNLANCNDAPNRLYCDTICAISNIRVKVRAIVVTPGGKAQNTSTGNRQFWVKDLRDTGAFTAIDVYPNSPNPTVPADVLDLLPGDTIEIVGRVEEYMGTNCASQDSETEIVPDSITLIGSSCRTCPKPQARLLDIGTFNNSSGQNILTTGEQWEGEFVEFRDVTVSNIVSFVTGVETRYRFDITDAQGNVMQVNDRFAAMRTRSGWIPPSTGDRYTSLKGVIIHQKNNCPGTSTFNRGYTLAPFDPSHFVVGVAAPSIGSIKRSPYTPSASQTATITASIASSTNSIASATLFYKDETSTTWQSVPMNKLGTSNRYSGSIPAFPENTHVLYYISATDNAGVTSNIPGVPAGGAALGYFVHSDGTHISDVQYFSTLSGTSAVVNDTVTLTGYVVSTQDSSNLGTVFIQQEKVASPFNGIWLQQTTSLQGLSVGKRIQVTGIVTEFRNVNTSLTNITSVTTLPDTATPTPLLVSYDSLSSYSVKTNEAYEGVFVKIQNPNGQLFVSDTNVVLAGTGGITPGTNYGEWRLGPDQNNKTRGTVIFTGRQSTTAFSSLAVSYVNTTRASTSFSHLWSGVSPVVINPGAKFNSAQGPVFQSFGTIKIMPRNNADLPGYVTEVKSLETNLTGIFPNPAESRVSINTGLGKPFVATLKNLTGQTVLENSFGNGQGQFGVETLANGIYMLGVASEGKPVKYVRLVVAH